MLNFFFVLFFYLYLDQFDCSSSQSLGDSQLTKHALECFPFDYTVTNIFKCMCFFDSDSLWLVIYLVTVNFFLSFLRSLSCYLFLAAESRYGRGTEGESRHATCQANYRTDSQG